MESVSSECFDSLVNSHSCTEASNLSVENLKDEECITFAIVARLGWWVRRFLNRNDAPARYVWSVLGNQTLKSTSIEQRHSSKQDKNHNRIPLFQTPNQMRPL